jgi:predicted heme/steroid binding protein
MELGNICSMLYSQKAYKREKGDETEIRTQRQREFTIEELSVYTGRDGNPAYVAVNGIVYDVTNNAAWAAASHFGLTAGKDLSGAFASCHANASILEKLIVVGKLI